MWKSRAELIERIRGLPRQQQLAYSMRYEHGMSDSEIGAVLDLTEDQVAVLMLRALQTLVGNGPNFYH